MLNGHGCCRFSASWKSTDLGWGRTRNLGYSEKSTTPPANFRVKIAIQIHDFFRSNRGQEHHMAGEVCVQFVGASSGGIHKLESSFLALSSSTDRG
ncbi:hypothetical protein TNCV_2650221 [Trichonephila clavipes]|nr:hypothetical protein TNCV_2650221 [Trichonephila clavipes]